MDMAADGTGGASTGSQHWGVALSWVLGILLGVAAAWFFVRLVRQALTAEQFRGRPLIQIFDSVANLVMAAGMGIAFIFVSA
jgi:flagellar biogenesis protein FliO